jgi:predicted enzyme related to lactoylglutathione lyase
MHDMTEMATTTLNKPTWVDLSTADPAAARTFYAKVFGWQIEVNPDPQYGGYALAKVDGQDAAGIGGIMSPGQPSAWSIYIGTDDIEALARKVTAAGGTVVAPPMDIPGQGWMAVFQDPSGAFISGWQATRMRGFQTEGASAFGWAEVSARGVEKVVPFYERVFGWTPKATGSPEQPYTEFQVDGHSIVGAVEMNPMVPAEVPSYWLVYFTVDHVDAAFRTAIDAGARELLSPIDFPGGRLAMVSDPQGASFGLMRMAGG